MSKDKGFVQFIPQVVWVDTEELVVSTVNGNHDRYSNVKFRLTTDNLVINSGNETIFYNLKNIIKFYHKEIKTEINKEKEEK